MTKYTFLLGIGYLNFNLFYLFMSIYQNDTQAVFETFLADLQDSNLPFLLQYFKALNEACNLDFSRLVKSRFPEYFKRLDTKQNLQIAA